MTPSRDAPCLDPIYACWRAWPHAASWTWEPRSRPPGDAAAERNPWGAAQLAGLLEAFGPIARIRELRFSTPPDVAILAVGHYGWTPDEPRASYERAALELVRTAVLPIAVIEVVLDLCVWVRRAGVPARAWIGPALWGSLQLDAHAPYGGLTVHHRALLDDDANAGLLERAFAAVTAGLGPIRDAPLR
jgi:hypothetical protein